MMPPRLAAFLLAGIALFASLPSAARPGDLDPSFGTGGVAAPPAFAADEAVEGVTGTAERWVVGTVVRRGAAHLFVAKLTAAGALDTTFGTGGKAMLPWDYSSLGYAIARQADGKLVVAGRMSHFSGTKMLVARFNADGTLDTSFGTNGATTVNPFGFSEAYALAIAADGSITVAGYASGSNPDMVVFRVTSSGALDPTFGTGGVKTIDFRGGFDMARAVHLVADGKVVVTGIGSQSSAGTNFDFAAVRLNADGSVDKTFGPAGQDGLALYDLSGAYDGGQVSVATGGGFVIGGVSQQPGQTRYEMSVLRITADGARDPLFGANGVAFVGGTASYFTRGLAVQADGKVVVCSTGRPTYARLTASGALDGTFGAGGIQAETDTALIDCGAIQANADGTLSSFGSRIVTASVFARDLAMVRYTSAGARDAAFGGGTGIVTLNLFSMNLDPRALALAPSGGILVAGMLHDTHDADAAVMRFTPSGQMDGYGSSNASSVPSGASFDLANAVVALPDGSAVIAGRHGLPATTSFLLAKFDPSGNLATANFGNTGRTIHTMGTGFAEALALARQPDGKFVSAGYAVVGPGNIDFALARYSENGHLDASFGTGGVVITPFGALNDVAQAVAVQPDGRIVAAGYTRVGSLFDIAVARYNADGSLDATFGTGGKAVIPASASNDQGAAIALTRDGKILVAGVILDGANENIAVVRLTATGALDTTFATGGIASIDIAGGTDRGWGIALQRNGKILVAGQGFDGAAVGFAAVRLNDDGTRDASFGANGVRTIDITGSFDLARAVAVQPDGGIVLAGIAGVNAAAVRLLGDPRKVTQADANDDGRDDLYWRDGGTGLAWWQMDGATVGSTAFQVVGAEWQLVDTGDFNGDRKADLVWRNTNDGSVYVWMLDGTTVVSAESPGAVGLEWALAGAADLDGDGRADLVFRNATTGQVYAWLMSGGTILGQGPIANPGPEWQIIDLADFDGDGKADILWRRTTDGLVYTWWMDGLAIRFAFSIASLDPALWQLVAAGDFNADGIADLLWRSTAGDTWVWLLDGAGGVTAGGLGNPGGAWSIRAVGDFDGDGRDDLLWRHTDGTTYLWKLKGASIASSTPVASPGGTWQVVAP
ncbi:MAG: VCBS repeat-containing protein [Burkholderiales bacterium]|nr:VCBS repeat-containing protein [Burkholderiales bacterium]